MGRPNRGTGTAGPKRHSNLSIVSPSSGIVISDNPQDMIN